MFNKVQMWSCHQTLHDLKNIEDSTKLFYMFKQYDNCQAVTVPQDCFVKHIDEMENTFVTEFSHNVQQADICRHLYSVMPNLSTVCQEIPASYLNQML